MSFITYSGRMSEQIKTLNYGNATSSRIQMKPLTKAGEGVLPRLWCGLALGPLPRPLELPFTRLPDCNRVKTEMACMTVARSGEVR